MIFWFLIYFSYLIGAIFAIPTHIATAFFCYFAVKDFFTCFIFLSLTSISCTLVNYLIFLKYKKKIFMKIENLRIIKVLKKRIRKRPFYVGIVTRCILFSAGLNDYICLLIGVPFQIYITTGILYHLISTALFLMLSERINSIRDIFDIEKWENTTGTEKISLITTTVFLTVTIASILYLCSCITK